jgi:hypothetical protein
MDMLVVAEAMLGAWSDIGGLRTVRVLWLAGLVDYLSFFWREFYAEIVFEDQVL